MKHEMKLRHAPFLAIKSGEKSIEMRLYDEKRSRIKTGDTIVFTDIDTGKTLRCLVTALYTYANFDALYRAHDKISIGYKKDERADPKDMLAYYAPSDIERYGVVAIEIKPIADSEGGKNG